MKTSAAARVALGLAAVLSIGSSIGLHPEPTGLPGSSDIQIGVVVGDGAPHRCLACLTFGTTLLSRPGGILPAGDRVATASSAPEPTPLGRLAGRDLSGRSPPR